MWVSSRNCQQILQPSHLQPLNTVPQPKKKIARKLIFKCLPPPPYDHFTTWLPQDPGISTPFYCTWICDTQKQHTLNLLQSNSDIIMTLPANPTNKVNTWQQENYPAATGIKASRNPRCTACTHLNTNPTYKSTSTGTTYSVCHSFSSISSQLIYLITCTKCRNNTLIGKTTNILNYRITRHRSSILFKANRYFCNHFTFPDHSIIPQ